MFEYLCCRRELWMLCRRARLFSLLLDWFVNEPCFYHQGHELELADYFIPVGHLPPSVCNSKLDINLLADIEPQRCFHHDLIWLGNEPTFDFSFISRIHSRPGPKHWVEYARQRSFQSTAANQHHDSVEVPQQPASRDLLSRLISKQ